jgi:hypothetical protein
MKLTFINRLKICFEVLTIRSGHAHVAHEKQLSTFQRGYEAGMKDERLLSALFEREILSKLDSMMEAEQKGESHE